MIEGELACAVRELSYFIKALASLAAAHKKAAAQWPRLRAFRPLAA